MIAMMTVTTMSAMARRGNTDVLTKTEWNTQTIYTQGVIRGSGITWGNG